MRKNLNKIYETDASQLKGKALEIVHPRTVVEVRGIVARSKRIVPRGGGTGLAGGAVPQHGKDVVLDLSKLNKIGGFDKARKTIEVGAGVILDDLQHYVERYGLEFPVNPASHSVCTLGGMIATDAVGTRAIKYGRTSNWVQWIEVVDGNGNVTRKGATELSDYSGMEGITGVIVKACLKLSPKRERSASLIKVESLDDVALTVKKLKMEGEVSAIEFLDKGISEGVGFGEGYHLVVEYEDGSGALKGKDYNKVMALRDEAYPFVAGKGFVRIEDPKIMIDKFPKLMVWLERKGVPVFGHVSVGILHPCFSDEQEGDIPEMIKVVRRLGGRVSGEHGIGILKKKYVEANDKRILVNVKKRTDPANKFNVGKII